ncbi:MAG: ABC transporter ATP-binding protein [Candidatus Alcyoniella australis]|nr:ABC transporter ATP-binding protein [Candidatus Alcyoniella australis]
MNVVSAHGLVKRFGEFIAVDDVSLEIEQGTVFGFLGPNGAGKTTTIRLLCGLLRPDGGAATVLGFDLAKQTDKIKERIGYMSQRFSLYGDLTVRQNLEFYAGIYQIPRARRRARLDYALQIADLQHEQHRLASQLPGGVRQRLALGAAILHEPQIVFLDEPTAGVDPANRRMFWDLIDQLRREGTTVFVTTHYMDEAENCGRLVLIYSGRKIAEASPRELVQRELAGTMFEVRSVEPAAAVGALSGASGVQAAQIYGRNARVLCDEGRCAQSDLERLLAAAGLEAAQVRPTRATLEDAFITLIEREDRRIAAQGGRTR